MPEKKKGLDKCEVGRKNGFSGRTTTTFTSSPTSIMPFTTITIMPFTPINQR
jgi:hypothetical protein